MRVPLLASNGSVSIFGVARTPAERSMLTDCKQCRRHDAHDRAAALLASRGDGEPDGPRRRVTMDDPSTEASSGTLACPLFRPKEESE